MGNFVYVVPGLLTGPVYFSSTLRTRIDPIDGFVNVERLIGGEWWVIRKTPSESVEDNFTGIFDITGLGIATIISNYAWYAGTVGAGTFLANDGPSAGIRITTGALANNSNLFASGDNTGLALTWAPAQEIWMHLHYRFPFAPDLLNMYFLGAFYRDNNNYIGMRYNTAVDNLLRVVTRSAGVETATPVGALDNLGHEVYVKITATEVRFVQDGGTVLVHTTNIPGGNFAWYTLIQTLNNVAKNYDVAHLGIIQTPSLFGV